MQHFRGLATELATFAISASKYGGQLCGNEFFLRDITIKSRIFERMENFQNDCCRPRNKQPFKNSYSRQLIRIVNAVVS